MGNEWDKKFFGCSKSNKNNSLSNKENSEFKRENIESSEENLDNIVIAKPAGSLSHAEEINSNAYGFNSYAEGLGTLASNSYSHAEGNVTMATGFASHAEGEGNTSSGEFSHAEGGGADPYGNSAPNLASGSSSHAEGVGTTASGFASHTEGGTEDITLYLGPVASGDFSHAEGQSTTASGEGAHAEGRQTTASGSGSHAEGFNTTASGKATHAEGHQTLSSGFASHAEGAGTFAIGHFSHSEGQSTTASGFASHAQGACTRARANFSHSEGVNTIVNPAHTGSSIMGQNGVTRFPFSWHLANGFVVGPPLNAAVIEGTTGNLYLDGTVVAPAAGDYAEMFETIDGNSIDAGYFVTLDGEGDKIRKAHAHDEYILGVVSARPAMIADASDLRWHNLFQTDDWGRVQYNEVIIPERRDEKGNVISPQVKKMEPILNPSYDPSQTYIPRRHRPEWVAVGIVGKLLVRDDGTCEPNGYCKPNDEGVATASRNGYRVMKRVGDNQIQIFIK
ncbi:peptidase G2 autoproteolytic cleavage domain-containing protein [Aneurinibacillus sp. Ricciae_BoGa-3]|uniref:peptidase G2 autoproteolytic cleavage domain-containing protein n=1 Tax=Aneurinibacillus sp. Ricciae_BoGa-3 TaxID=3022697 RepID=UPI00233F8944|nr:peptidase G2 autoproteolytic cleavage domain-containing protein [Aneurinibacillus sp. Ricciae_BoGa-3]WCK56164.1 peptidase G2 autoproteolytic cleavage domain-containing protein [Aneurinibacillus sp. Ricciae_BoGa-3]